MNDPRDDFTAADYAKGAADSAKAEAGKYAHVPEQIAALGGRVEAIEKRLGGGATGFEFANNIHEGRIKYLEKVSVGLLEENARLERTIAYGEEALAAARNERDEVCDHRVAELQEEVERLRQQLRRANEDLQHKVKAWDNFTRGWNGLAAEMDRP